MFLFALVFGLTGITFLATAIRAHSRRNFELSMDLLPPALVCLVLAAIAGFVALTPAGGQ